VWRFVGKMIAQIQQDGKLVPSEITVELIKKAIGKLYGVVLY
jgi:adenylate kinase family enzyme